MSWALNAFEQQIITAAEVGLDDEEIAEAVGSTANEVKAILERVMSDLGLASRLELTLFVYWHGGAGEILTA